MTGPASQSERTEALEAATRALAHAEDVRDRGATIAQGWRQSRTDNNFRQMLLAIGKKAERSA